MSVGDVHQVTPELHVVEGHHPHTMWEDPDIPSVAVFRSGRRVYLLDTGVGPEQRSAITELVGDDFDELVVLNSHGHVDHLGNNDLLAELGAGRQTRHHLPRAARPALDSAGFFLAMYSRGLPYFDFLTGLTIDGDQAASLLRALGAPAELGGDDLDGLGRRLRELGLLPAMNKLLPAMVTSMIAQTYPPTFPSVETITDFEDLGPATAIDIGPTSWTGWTFTDDAGEPEVHVLQSAGHSAGGVVFYLPGPRAMLLADETTTVPIWADTDPQRTVVTLRKVVELIDDGSVETICAGHRPMLPLAGAEAKAILQSTVALGDAFAATVEAELRRHPDGIGIDELTATLVADASPGSPVAVLASLQFPVFATFLKLTVLNHCLLLDLPEDRDADGRPRFRVKD